MTIPPNLKLKSNVVLVTTAVVIVLLAFWGGYTYGKTQIPSQYLIEGIENQTLGQPDNVDFSLFWDAWRVIHEQYL